MMREMRGAATRGAALAALGAIGLGAFACGARSQLYVTDAPAPRDAAPPDAPSACVHEQPSQTPAPAYIEIVLDGSGSMAEVGKWSAATMALDGLLDEYLAHPDPTVSIGLLVFSDSRDASGGDGPYPTALDVPPEYVDAKQYAALRGRIDASHPVGPTPTLAALTGGYDVLRAYVPSPRLKTPGRRVAVLVSDGAPTPASAAGEVDVEKARTLKLVADALGGSPALTTFSIGIGPFPPPVWFDYDPAFMSDIAIAGGTRAKPDCDPASPLLDKLCHIQITPSKKRTPEQLAADMLAALHEVRTRTIDLCAFDLVGDFTRFVAGDTRVKITSRGVAAEVPADPTNGWRYDSAVTPRAVILEGASCAKVLDEAAAAVTMTFGCAT